MTLSQLEYFCALAKFQQFTKAALEMNISQPSMSYAISELERDLGVTLIKKHERKIILTPYGEFFLSYAKRTLDTLEEGVQLTRQMIDPTSGTVSLGYFHSISADFLPKLIESFNRTNSDSAITFRFAQFLNREILDEIKSGNIDLAFCASFDSSVKYEKVVNQRLYAVVPQNHRLAKCTDLELKDLEKEKMVVLDEKSGLRKTVEDLFKKNGLKLNVSFEAPECNSALQSVFLSQAVAVMPRIPAMQIQPVVVIPLRNEDCFRPVYLVWNSDELLMPPVKRVRDFILSEKVFK